MHVRTPATMVLALLLSLLPCSNALGANWREIATSASSDRHLVDLDSVAPLGRLVKFWKKMVLARPARLEDGTTYDATMTLNYADCERHSTGFTRLIVFYRGRAIWNEVYPLQMTEPQVAAVAEGIIEAVCGPLNPTSATTASSAAETASTPPAAGPNP